VIRLLTTFVNYQPSLSTKVFMAQLLQLAKRLLWLNTKLGTPKKLEKRRKCCSDLPPSIFLGSGGCKNIRLKTLCHSGVGTIPMVFKFFSERKMRLGIGGVGREDLLVSEITPTCTSKYDFFTLINI